MSLSNSKIDNPLDDICPVCKSNRYLNPSLQFLINTECYHKMCSTCVDRIFTSGPASCPVPHCGKTLRKKGFHKAFFEDLKVEREVDIRKRVGEVFNKRQDDFETLLNWNDYLEHVEGLVFDLVEGNVKDKVAAEEQLKAYRAMNLQEIEENRKAGLAASDLEKRREASEREAARQRRIVQAREMQEEKMGVQKMKMETLERLATTDEDPNAITRQAQKIILKKSGARRNLADSLPTEGNGNGNLSSSLSIRGLKKKVVQKAVDKHYDPFGGIDLTPSRFVIQNDYDNEYIEKAKKDREHIPGGYSFHEYYARTLFEAFSGLGVFIKDEVGSREPPAAPSSIGTAGAAQAAGGTMKQDRLTTAMDVDNVF